MILNLIQVQDRLRARVHWATLPFDSEGHRSLGCEQFVDLTELELAPPDAQLQLL